ncbi:TlpA disulfide reductase family protein [Lysinibacillus sp. KU-BSD001]|uniref:TlpA family protein disulfide reductase n=1 Tax=Lysinibacillus sp. KU-BSD001 TaxID=3141328 RepID=UPI0036F10C67
MKKWIGLVIIIILIGAVAWNSLKGPAEFGLTDEGTGLEKGDTPPQFKLETLNGEPLSLQDVKGKKVILNFWATWCDPCREEMPVFEAYDAKHEDVIVLAVNITKKDVKVEKIAQFVDDYGLTFPILLDETDDVSKAYEVITIPSTYFLDEEGIIQMKINGSIDETMLDLYVGQL